MYVIKYLRVCANRLVAEVVDTTSQDSRLTETDADVGRSWSERRSQRPVVRLTTVAVNATYRMTQETAVVSSYLPKQY